MKLNLQRHSVPFLWTNRIIFSICRVDAIQASFSTSLFLDFCEPRRCLSSIGSRFLAFPIMFSKASEAMACNCQLMQDTPLLKFPCPRLILLFVLLIRLSQVSSDVDEQLSKSVKDKVLLPCRYNSPHEDESEDRIYWQKHDKVVLSVIAGKLKVWPEYKNRTLYDNTTYSLIILGLVLSDRGTYSCVVQKKERGTYEVKHLALVKLSIKADFSTPNITESGNPSADTKRITCFASGGFPKPRFSWLENGRELPGINTTISQDPESELYTISSQLDFNTTRNHTIKCLIKYGDAHVSEDFTWEKPPEDPPDSKNTLVLFGAGFGAVITVVVIVVIIKCFCKHRSCFRRNEASRETNNSLTFGPEEALAEQTVFL